MTTVEFKIGMIEVADSLGGEASSLDVIALRIFREVAHIVDIVVFPEYGATVQINFQRAPLPRQADERAVFAFMQAQVPGGCRKEVRAAFVRSRIESTCFIRSHVYA